MFSFQDDHINDFALSGLQATLVEFEHEASTFDLTLNLRRHSDHLLAIFEYSADLFDLSTIERLAENFQALLMGIVGDPQAPLQALPLTAPSQLARVLLDFNRTELAGDPGPPVHAIFQRQVAARPDAIAITDGDRTITYAVLNSRANRLARQLVELGVGPGILVAVCLPRSIETVVAVLATLKAGGAYVPLDPEQPERRLQNMLDDSQAPLLLTTDELRLRLPDDASRRVLCLDGLDSRQIERFSDADLESRSSLDDLAYVVYTSGSTGTPKGVMIAHRAVLNTHHGCRIGYRLGEIGEGMSYLQMANPAFDVFTGDWVRALCNGGRLVLCPIGLLAAPDELHRRMVAENIGFAEFVPAVVRRLCDLLEATGQRLDFMHVCVVGSDVFHVRDYRRLRALCRPDAQVTNSYGLTEAAIDSTIADHVDGALIGDAIAPIGRPMVNVRTYILDEALQPVPLGVRGELCVAGLGLADGYFRRPELTAEKFVEIELVGRRERIYRTGDLARWRPSGDLEFLGRLDHQVQLRGLRIELGEIEAAMLEHPSVREAVVMLGSESTDPMLVAWLVLSTPLTDVALALREFLASRVPRYMVPSTFVVLPALPVTPNGKVDRRALPEPDNARRDRFVEPRDGVELKLVLIWEELIGRAPIGVHDDFFALGGDSLLSVRLVSVLERTFGVRVPLHVLFQCGTIERLASVLRRESVQTPWSPLVCLQPAGKRAPFFFIHAAGGIVFRYTQVAALLGDQRPFYGIQARGIEPGDPPYPSIEVMAADYVRAIVEIQPKGPYLLGGWSFGGTVAYAMAQLLVARGESVPMLVMVDAPSPYVDDYEEDDVEFLLERLRPAAGLELADLHVHDTKEAKLRYLFEQQRFAELFAPDIDIADAALRLGIHKHHNKIICEYRPTGPCPTKIVFFQPSESITFDKRMRNPVPAWRELAQGGMEVHTAPGNHFNMFSADNGPVLAELLRACVVGLP
jgi:amino acid adenylation domain-containing protein